MTWNLSKAGISDSTIPLYDSPFAPSANRLAAGASKVSFGVAEKNYTAASFKKYLQPQNANIANKRAANRMDYDAYAAMDFKVDEPVSESFKHSACDEAYTYMTEINSSAEWKNKMAEQEAIVDGVKRKIIENAAVTVQHKIFGTALPSKYICKIIFLTLLEQAFANKYSNGSVHTDAFTTPRDVCDAMYKIYKRDNINTNKSALAKKTKTNALIAHLEDASVAVTEFEFTNAATINRSQLRINMKFNYNPERRIYDTETIKNIIESLKESITKSASYCSDDQIKELRNILGSGEYTLSTQQDLVMYLTIYEKAFGYLVTTVTPDEVMAEIGAHLIEIAHFIEKENAIAIADVRGDEMIVVADTDKNTDKTITTSCLMKVALFDQAFTEYVTKAIYTRESFGDKDTDSEYAKLTKKVQSIENEIADGEDKIKSDIDDTTKQMLEIKNKELQKMKKGIEDEIAKLDNVDEVQPSPINNTDVSIVDGHDKRSVVQILDDDIDRLEREMSDAWNRFKHRRLLERKKRQRVKVVGIKMGPISIKESCSKKEDFRNYGKEPPATQHLLMIVIVILIVMCLAIFAIYNLCLCKEKRQIWGSR